MTLKHPGLIPLAFALALVGCASPSAEDRTAAPPGLAQPTALLMVVNSEVGNLSPKAFGDRGPAKMTRIFNADLTLSDAQDVVHPYLAESLPQLNADGWLVFPDGRMETTWKLRAGLTWQDGQPLTAEDFVFAFKVYKVPDLGIFTPKPQDIIERVVAADPQTVRIYWRSPFLDQGEGLSPLPRHVLSAPFAALEQDPVGQRDAFTSLRFWKAEYLGAGPYRLTNWELGSHMEGAAFDGHVLGRPKIDRIVIRLINNENTALANIMAGGAHLTMAQAIQFDQAMVLRQQAGFNDVERRGTVLFAPGSINGLCFQFRPEHLRTPGLLDVRVRQAMIHAIDRDAISERLFQGLADAPISFVYPGLPYYADVDRVITKYPYDSRRTELLMGEAGYSRGRDGFFVDFNGERFQPALWNSAEALNQTAGAIVLDAWQKAGIDAQQTVMPDVLSRDLEARYTFPGTLINGGFPTRASPTGLDDAASRAIASPANRWLGQNRGGWSSPDYEVLWERYNSTLDRAEQISVFVQAMKLHSEQVPNYPLHVNLQVVSHVAAVKGPQPTTVPLNIHEWEWQ